MADDRKPGTLSADELEKVKGGYSVWIGGSVKTDPPEDSNITLDNGLKQTSVIADNAGVDSLKKR